jgi:hypothetical protein
LTSLTALALFGMTVTSDVNAAFGRDKDSADKQIQACVAEVGRHANYGDASRVLHRISSLNQRNLVELKIRIETSVFSKSEEAVVREFTASCVTDPMGDVVKFRIDTS